MTRRFDHIRRGAALLIVLALGACARSGPPAPVYDGHGGPAYPGSRQTVAMPSNMVTVDRGETLYSIARRHGVSLRALIDRNDIDPPYAVAPGQRLVLPRQRQHRVQRGETVYGIARLYGVDMSELVRLNHIAPPYTIVPGQSLNLPAPVRLASLDPAAGLAKVAPPPPPAQQRSPGRSIWRPVPRGPASAAPAASSPRVRYRWMTPDGPLETAALPGSPQATAPAQAPASSPSAASPAPAPPQAIARLPEPTEPPVRDLTPPRRESSRFAWPVQGRVLSGFGDQGGGLHNDGINIAARRGRPVRAAENGVVVYAGNQLRGFGKLILIRHDDGWMTAYGHNDTIRVRRGDKVRRGQTVATVGRSGSVTKPQLHFEIRRNGVPVDPAKYLASSRASL